jgi:hypothetical protein
MIKVKCSWCGKDFLKPEAWAKRTKKHYCCRECCDNDWSKTRKNDSEIKSIMECARSFKKKGNNVDYKRVCGKLEHRAIMESIIGRELKKDEVVHHKNGNIHDNRPENLELMLFSEHSRYHRKKYFQSDDNRKKQSKKNKAWWDNASVEEIERRKEAMRVPKRKVGDAV